MKLVFVNIWNKFNNVLYIFQKFQNKGILKKLSLQLSILELVEEDAYLTSYI